MARVVYASVPRHLHKAAALVAKQRIDWIRRAFVAWECSAVDEVYVQVLVTVEVDETNPRAHGLREVPPTARPGDVLELDPDLLGHVDVLYRGKRSGLSGPASGRTQA